MYGGPLGNIKQLYLYDRVTRLYGMSILYWVKLKYIIFSFPYVIHVCMEEALLGTTVELKKIHFLLGVARILVVLLCGASLWLLP